jgi:hypothetical protein
MEVCRTGCALYMLGEVSIQGEGQPNVRSLVLQ